MTKTTLSSWYNSSAWDEPEQAPVFPYCAIKFDKLEAWVAAEIAENYPDVDVDEVAADAQDSVQPLSTRWLA